MNEYEGCRGCYLSTITGNYPEDNNVHTCDLPWTKNNKKCPCTICLIKGMCRESCAEFTVYDGCNLGQKNKEEEKEELS